jgi:hypothetical protein
MHLMESNLISFSEQPVKLVNMLANLPIQHQICPDVEYLPVPTLAQPADNPKNASKAVIRIYESMVYEHINQDCGLQKNIKAFVLSSAGTVQ